MIRFDNVSMRYPGGYEALSRLSFELARGEMAFLTGHSGAGKSTLLKLIMLMERSSQGQVFVDEQNLNRMPVAQIPFLRRKIGVVFQNHQLLFDRTVFDNVALPLQISGYEHDSIGRRVRAALDKVGLLNKERLNPIVLSTGEQQRIGLARAIVNKPQLLLADEPTGNLDAANGAAIMDMLMDLRDAHGATLVLVTHDSDLAARCDRIVNLRDGMVETV